MHQEGEESIFAEGDRVRVTGLKTRPDLNGILGSIIEWDDAERRWKVHMDDGSGKMLRTCHLEMVSGSKGASKTPPDQPPTRSPKPDEAVKPRIAPNILVRIKGIKVRPELNGLQGVVTAWDPREESWAVRLHGAEASAQNLFGVVKNFREEDLEVPAGEAEPQPFVKAGLPLNSVVRILKLQKRPELNGQLGTVVGWDTVEDRCQVRLGDGSGLLLKACNMEPVPKDAWRRKTHPARVKTSSSQQQWQMNGLCGTNVEETIREPCYQLQPGSRIQVVDLKRQKERNGSKGSALEWVEQIERWKVVLDDGSSVLLRTNHLLPIGRGWDSSTAQTCE